MQYRYSPIHYKYSNCHLLGCLFSDSTNSDVSSYPNGSHTCSQAYPHTGSTSVDSLAYNINPPPKRPVPTFHENRQTQLWPEPEVPPAPSRKYMTNYNVSSVVLWEKYRQVRESRVRFSLGFNLLFW